MRTKAIFVCAVVVAAGLALTGTVERSDTGGLGLSAAPKANALFLRRAFRSVSRAVGGAVRSVQRGVQNVGKAVTKTAQNVGKAVTKTAQNVGKAVGKAAEGVGKAVKQAAQAVVKGVQGVAELAKKGVAAIGDAVKKGLLALKDLLGWVWKTMRDKLFGPVASYFKGLIEKAKGALQKLVDKAMAALKGVFMDNVLKPAIEWAFKKLFPQGQATLDKIRAIVQRILGKADRLIGQAEAFAATLEAIAQKNLAKYEDGLRRFDGALDRWSKITLTDLAEQLVAWARDKVTEFVRGKTLDLLSKAYKVVETPINAGKTAALAAISTIPFAGGAIAGAADVVITLGLSALRDAGFKFIADEAAKLAGKAIDWAGGFLVKGAGALDAKILPVVQPIMNTLKPLVSKALGLVDGVHKRWQSLRDKLRQARSFVQNAQRDSASQAAVR